MMKRILMSFVVLLMCSVSRAGEQEALDSLALAIEDQVAAVNLHDALVQAYVAWVAAHNGTRVQEAEDMIEEGEEIYGMGWASIQDGQDAFNRVPPDYDEAEAFFWEAEMLFEVSYGVYVEMAALMSQLN